MASDIHTEMVERSNKKRHNRRRYVTVRRNTDSFLRNRRKTERTSRKTCFELKTGTVQNETDLRTRRNNRSENRMFTQLHEVFCVREFCIKVFEFAGFRGTAGILLTDKNLSKMLYDKILWNYVTKSITNLQSLENTYARLITKLRKTDRKFYSRSGIFRNIRLKNEPIMYMKTPELEIFDFTSCYVSPYDPNKRHVILCGNTGFISDLLGFLQAEGTGNIYEWCKYTVVVQIPLDLWLENYIWYKQPYTYGVFTMHFINERDYLVPVLDHIFWTR